MINVFASKCLTFYFSHVVAVPHSYPIYCFKVCMFYFFLNILVKTTRSLEVTETPENNKVYLYIVHKCNKDLGCVFTKELLKDLLPN